MSEEQAPCIADAEEMLGKGYHSGPPKVAPSKWSGFTPAPDIIITSCGYVTALVWGKVWRYCQGRDGICRAKLERLADELGMSERTIIRHLEMLTANGYLRDSTPDLRNKPHIYADTGKIRIGISVEASMTESQPAMTESQRQGDRESVEDSIKIDSKKENTVSSKQKIHIRGIEASIAMNRTTSEDDLIPETKPPAAIIESLAAGFPYNFPKYGENQGLDRVAKLIVKDGRDVQVFIRWAKANKRDPHWYHVKPDSLWGDWPQAFTTPTSTRTLPEQKDTRKMITPKMIEEARHATRP